MEFKCILASIQSGWSLSAYQCRKRSSLKWQHELAWMKHENTNENSSTHPKQNHPICSKESNYIIPVPSQRFCCNLVTVQYIIPWKRRNIYCQIFHQICAYPFSLKQKHWRYCIQSLKIIIPKPRRRPRKQPFSPWLEAWQTDQCTNLIKLS